jgi:ribosomal protein S27AE
LSQEARVIDRSGEWWTGEGFDDLAEYLRVVTAEGYPADRVLQSVCSCGGTTHCLDADPVESVAQRTCVACGTSAFIVDSDEHWSEARAERWHCACGNDTAELGVAFSLRSDGEVRWITVGQRCSRCGLLDVVVDWKIDYGPSTHLLAQV